MAIAASPADDDVERLPARRAIPVLTQRLLDALPSDSTVWQRYLSDSALYVSEAGEVASKAELLEGFGPFPPGLSGAINVRDVRITDFGDLAIAVIRAREKQTVYDQRLEVDYLATHTWRREKGRWRLLAAHTMVLPRDPRPLPLDARAKRDFVGIYELSGKRRYRVEARGDTLVGGRESRPPMPLIAVGDNVFAETGNPLGTLRIFVRGPDGTVRHMIERRKFADLVWVRLPATSPEREPGR